MTITRPTEQSGAEIKMMAKKAPNPTDKHVGARVRMRRMMLGMSQEKLGDALGLTFQQVQKYEKGANRIGASRLQQIAHILQVSVSFFFEGAPSVPGHQADGMSEAPSPAYVSDFLATSDGLALTKAFMRIKDGKLRRRIVDLVEQMVERHRPLTRGRHRGSRRPRPLRLPTTAHILTALEDTAKKPSSFAPARPQSPPLQECATVSRANYLFTSESVSEGHPDKVCDQISDAILDAFIESDIKLGIADDSQINTRLGCETLCTTNKIVVAGEGRGQLFRTIHGTVGGRSRADHRDRARRRQGHRLRPERLLVSRRRRRGAAARPVARHRHGRQRQEEEGRGSRKAPATRA